MEMESSRRPFDRSREPGLKKPRLSDDPIGLDRSGRSSSFIQRPTNSSSIGSRFRTGGEIGGDSESSNNNSVMRGGAYPQTQQQHQEIVNQYKSALAELTFNSKPIITNLTIIAGEYLYAAKAIAATVCGNILEVPRDQKLPSLYLLDSIVKNIGRDYIKYFAVRLPEVFCKVYNQADPSIHPGMRHLFGTWKGVFPLQTLQAIEKELGFVSAANGSSSGTTSRSDAPRPAHSIHVNPKYLEARRLQQSARAKGAAGNISGSLVSSPNHLERLERTPSISSEGAWADPSVKSIQRPREQLSDSVHGKNVAVAYGDSEYDSDITTRSGLAIGRAGDKFKPDKPWFDSENVRGRVSNQNNGFVVKHGLQSHPALRSSNPATSIKPTNNFNSNVGVTESWKNSEEEEYMWEDINSRPADHSTANISGRDHWTPDDSERTSEASADSLSTEMKSQATFGSQLSSSWSKETGLPEGIRHPLCARDVSGYSESYPASLSTGSAIGRPSFQPKTGPENIGTPGYGLSTNATLGSGGATGKLRHALGGASPSAQLPMHQRPCSPSFTLHTTNQVPQHLPELDKTKVRSRADPRISHFSESLNDPGTKFNQDLLQLPSRSSKLANQRPHSPDIQNPSSKLANQRPHSPDIQNPSSGTPLRLGGSVSFTQQKEPEPLVSELSRHLQKPLLPQTRCSSVGTKPTIPDDANPLSMLSSGQSGTRSLLAAVMNNGILGGTPVTGSLPQLTSRESIPVTSKASKQPVLPSGPSTQFSAAGLNTTSSLSGQPSHKSTLGSANLPQRNAERPPLPPGSLPSSSASTPVSNLLSTLVAKGLISASKTEPPATITDKVPAQPVNQNTKIANSSSIQVSPASVSVPLSSLNKASEMPPAKSVSKSPTLPQPVEADIKNQIGFDFKPDVLRVSHPLVIKELLDDLPHKCSVCGLRLKIQERLARHLEWHDSRNQNKNNLNKTSREWYAHSNDWIAGDGGYLSSDISSEDISAGPSKQLECDEPMVPADESQCLCILCGELFDDFYDQETDQWMFRGAVYTPVPCSDVEPGGSDAVAQGSIVHATCIATS